MLYNIILPSASFFSWKGHCFTQCHVFRMAFYFNILQFFMMAFNFRIVGVFFRVAFYFFMLFFSTASVLHLCGWSLASPFLFSQLMAFKHTRRRRKLISQYCCSRKKCSLKVFECYGAPHTHKVELLCNADLVKVTFTGNSIMLRPANDLRE